MMRFSARAVTAVALAAALTSLAACSKGDDTGTPAPAGDGASAKPAGADQTTITDWADPRPADWGSKYKYFGPASTGDGSLARVQKADKLVICASLGFKPYAFYKAGTKDVEGFEHDMALYLADVLGVKNLEYKNLDFSALIPAVGSKSCDFVMTGITIRTDRASAPGVKFTTPYVKLFDQITVRKDSGINGLADLKGKRIASTVASTDLQIAEAYVKDQLPGAKVQGFNGTNDCFTAVETKNVDACWLDVASTSTAIVDFPALRVAGDAVPYVPVGSFAKDAVENPYSLGAVGLVTNADDGDLNLALSLAVDKMVADGTQEKILTQWNLWGPAQRPLVRADA